jgi:hypothetical protein
LFFSSVMFFNCSVIAALSNREWQYE